jgi:hypothetical protein
MSALAPESLQRTLWADPLHVLANAPWPNASTPGQPVRWPRPPRLPRPPPVFGDALAVFDGAASAAAGAAAQSEALASAAAEGLEKLLGSSTDSHRRELLRSGPRVLPLRALRRVHRQATRRLLPYQKDIESNVTMPQIHTWRHMHNSTHTHNMYNATHSSTRVRRLTTELDGLDSLHAVLVVAVILLMVALAVGIVRGWWNRQHLHEPTVAEEIHISCTEKSQPKDNKIDNVYI